MLQMLRTQLGQTSRLAVCLGLFVVMAVVMFIITSDIPMRQLYLLQTTWSAEEFAAIIGNWRDNGILQSFESHFVLDFFYPLAYGAVLLALLGKALNTAQATRKANLVLLMPLVAMAADWGENICHLVFLNDPELVRTGWFYLGPLAANIKWWLINLSLIGALYYFIKKIMAILSARWQKNP